MYERLKGKWIAIDGVDACGKTTQVERLEKILGQHIKVLRVREPGYTKAGKVIRELVLYNKDIKLDPVAECLLFLADRAQLIAECVKPALRSGHCVLSDRSFISTSVYQYPRLQHVSSIAFMSMLGVANQSVMPDLIAVLDVSLETMKARIGDRCLDKIEGRTDTVQSLIDNYRRVQFTGQVVIDANGSVDDVTDRILEILNRMGG